MSVSTFSVVLLLKKQAMGISSIMVSVKRIITAVLCATILSFNIYAASFTIAKIQINGLQRVSEGTVLNYLPVQVGDTITDADTNNIIRALYKTGFFTNITLDRQGNTLIINVQESPTIQSIKLSGNKLISTKDLLKALNGLGITVGQSYDPSLLAGVKQSLEREYYAQGNYAAVVSAKAIPDSNGSVTIQITVDEGAPAKIHDIKIIGNQAFKQSTLLRQFKLTTPHIWNLFSKNDQYSKEKLDGDIENLKSYYMDRGYIEFKVVSTDVTISPDKRDVYIVITISEGPQYKLQGYQFSGDLIFPEDKLTPLITLKPGEIFSQQAVTSNVNRLGNYYGNFGYAFARVQPVPNIDQTNHTVMINFAIDPGNKVYVRNINFTGNTKTADEVMRREMRQQEGALVNTANIQQSERRLNQLGFFKTVKVNTDPVPGSDDQVDLDVNVVEAPSATLTAGVGYSDTNGLLLNASFSQPNFLGTGKNLGISANTSDFQRYFNISYFNPYYTDSGIGRGISLFASTTNTDGHDIDISTYAMDTYGVNMNYTLPMSETNTLGFGYGYQESTVKLGHQPSQELVNFMNGTNTLPPPPPGTPDHRRESFNNITLTGSFSHINFDKGIFPTKGIGQSIDGTLYLPGGNRNQTYYKADYLIHWYQPLFAGFILSTRGEAGYGAGLGSTKYLPFYENYYAGGIGVQGAVRGYEGYSIGPQDSNGDTFGGNALVDGTIALVIPTPLPDSMRISAFSDFGNVYVTDGVKTTTGSGPMRFSAGISFEWRSPIGPLVLSLADPLNIQKQDNREILQFTVGTSF